MFVENLEDVDETPLWKRGYLDYMLDAPTFMYMKHPAYVDGWKAAREDDDG